MDILLKTLSWLDICSRFSKLHAFLLFKKNFFNLSWMDEWKMSIWSSLLHLLLYTHLSLPGSQYSNVLVRPYSVFIELWCPNCGWAVTWPMITPPYLSIVLFSWKFSKCCLCFFHLLGCLCTLSDSAPNPYPGGAVSLLSNPSVSCSWPSLCGSSGC